MRVVVSSAVLDLHARSAFQEFTQFNGFVGCAFCKALGETVWTPGGGYVRSYPYNSSSQTGHHEVRIHEDTKKSAYDAQRSGKPVNGVKDHSLFHLVPKFNIIENVAKDYMHGLVLGVVKMLVSLWFNLSHHNSTAALYIQDDKMYWEPFEVLEGIGV